MTSLTVNLNRLVNSAVLPESERAVRARDLSDFAARLRSVSERARKLLLHIAQKAYHGRGQERKLDVAYLPELYESTGLDVESMYELLKELQAARFIDVEDRYPFEDVRILSCGSGWDALSAIYRVAEAENIPIRDIIVELRFELLP